MSPVKPPRTRPTRVEVRERILDAASKVFAAEGFAGATIDAVVERAGGSKATVYGLFGNKEGLFGALVAQGANQINGPSLTVDKPEAALDEARVKAIAAARARAELYARSLGMRVVRVVAVSESGGYAAPPPAPPMPMFAKAERDSTSIQPGEQNLQVSVTATFELQ